jgi:hypothetical protein
MSEPTQKEPRQTRVPIGAFINASISASRSWRSHAGRPQRLRGCGGARSPLSSTVTKRGRRDLRRDIQVLRRRMELRGYYALRR